MNIFENLIGKLKIHFAPMFQWKKESKTSNVSLSLITIADASALKDPQAVRSLEQLLNNPRGLFTVERMFKQIGFNETLAKARLDEIESPQQIDRGWFLHWMEIAQKTTAGDVQDMVAKILRGEFQNPNTFSVRTLEVLKNLSQNELQIFQNFCNVICRSAVFGVDSVITEPYGANPGNNTMSSVGLDYSNLTTLVNAGLIHSEIMGAHRKITSSSIFLIPLTIGDRVHVFQRAKPVEESEKTDSQIGILRLTQAGLELSNVMPRASNTEYNSKFLEWIAGKWDFVPQSN